MAKGKVPNTQQNAPQDKPQQHQPAQGRRGHGNRSHTPSYLTFFDRFSIVWLALSGWIHIVLEGAFVYNNKLIQKAFDKMPASIHDYETFYLNKLPSSNHPALNYGLSFVEFLKSLWKNYSCGDTRYALSDNFIVSVEGVTAIVAGPMCFILIYAIAYRRPWRHAMQLMLTTMQLYGLGLYFVTEHLHGYTHTDLSSIKCHLFYYWFFNLLWLFVPGMMWLASWRHISRSETKVQHQEHHNTLHGGFFWFLIKLIIAANVMGMTLIIFGAFGSHYLDDAIANKTFEKLLHGSQVEKLFLDAKKYF